MNTVISKEYKDSLTHWYRRQCIPRCHSDNSGGTTSLRRLRKHSNTKKKHNSDPGYKKFHNSVLVNINMFFKR